MSISVQIEGRIATLSLDERFNFEIHRDFRDAYSKCKPNSAFVIDMKRVEYLDSSALGMLLLLREYAGADKADVRIINCKSMVERLLKVANFDRLFKIT
ncbi:MAG: STAS domain-containing protein [Magnetococcales bacterium]|nr:STAS domain-containing protein [Magnetococcales bacterium]